jgi:hypothetical protein
MKLEPPTADRVERLIRSAIHKYEELFLRQLQNASQQSHCRKWVLSWIELPFWMKIPIALAMIVFFLFKS